MFYIYQNDTLSFFHIHPQWSIEGNRDHISRITLFDKDWNFKIKNAQGTYSLDKILSVAKDSELYLKQDGKYKRIDRSPEFVYRLMFDKTN